MMKETERIIQLLEQNRILTAIKSIRTLASELHLVEFNDRIDEAEDNYRRMLDFMLKGYQDSQRDVVFGKIESKLVDIVNEIKYELILSKKPVLSNARNIGGKDILYPAVAQNTFENFVSDAAMLSLESGNDKSAKMQELNTVHFNYLNKVFSNILVSFRWADDIAAEYSKMLLSPTVDTVDAQVIVTAIGLSLPVCFDYNKFYTLLYVYQHATDEYVRQRALVGWVFALGHVPEESADKVSGLLDGIVSDKKVQEELLGLQKQVFYCLSAEKDNREIQKNIMPDLMKHSNFNVTRFGITEKEDTLNDILHPEASDEAMEDMEKTMKRMMDMQKGGSDIYFGGFSQMKRFHFFSTLINWFIPYYTEHPSLQNVMNEGRGFLSMLQTAAPFCNSDKYSFVLAMDKVMGNLPDNVKELIGNGSVMGGASFDNIVDKNTSDYIRRMFLQDLYRFYRISDMRYDFVNPFDVAVKKGDDFPNCFFLLSTFFSDDELSRIKTRLGKFLYKRGDVEYLDMLLESYEEKTEDYAILKAYALISDCVYEPAIQMLETLLLHKQENEGALRLIARASFEDERYDDAAEYYKRLTLLHPENKKYMMNFCVSLLNSGEEPKAINYIYKLDLQYPDDVSVRRLLAWGLVCMANFEKAEDIYRNLIASSHCVLEDYLNAGYCSWFSGDIKSAVERFRHVVSLPEHSSLAEYFRNDSLILSKNHIGELDKIMMEDLVGLDGVAGK